MQNVPFNDIPYVEVGPPRDWPSDVPCATLAVAHVETDEGPFMLTAWRPTADDLASTNNGKAILLYVRGRQHPVIAFGVEG